MQKRLFKSNKDKIIFGVCGGIGKYFGIDSTLVRLLLALLVMMAGTGLVAYLVVALIIPKAAEGEEDALDATLNSRGIVRLYRAKDGAKLFGVCQGLANAYNLDVTVVRVVVALVCCLGIGVLAYFVAGFIIPIVPSARKKKKEQSKE